MLGYISVAESLGVSSTTFTQSPPEAFCEPVFVSQVDVFSTRL